LPTKKFSEVVVKYPVYFIVFILIISGIMAYGASNATMTTTEKSFSPSSDVGNANDFIGAHFGREGEFVQIVARSTTPDKDILTVESFIEILEFEEDIEADPAINPVLNDERAVSSIPDLVFTGFFLADMANETAGMMIEFVPELANMSLGPLSDGIEGLNGALAVFVKLDSDDTLTPEFKEDAFSVLLLPAGLMSAFELDDANATGNATGNETAVDIGESLQPIDDFKLILTSNASLDVKTRAANILATGFDFIALSAGSGGEASMGMDMSSMMDPLTGGFFEVAGDPETSVAVKEWHANMTEVKLQSLREVMGATGVPMRDSTGLASDAYDELVAGNDADAIALLDEVILISQENETLFLNIENAWLDLNASLSNLEEKIKGGALAPETNAAAALATENLTTMITLSAGMPATASFLAELNQTINAASPPGYEVMDLLQEGLGLAGLNSAIYNMSANGSAMLAANVPMIQGLIQTNDTIRFVAFSGMVDGMQEGVAAMSEADAMLGAFQQMMEDLIYISSSSASDEVKQTVFSMLGGSFGSMDADDSNSTGTDEMMEMLGALAEPFAAFHSGLESTAPTQAKQDLVDLMVHNLDFFAIASLASSAGGASMGDASGMAQPSMPDRSAIIESLTNMTTPELKADIYELTHFDGSALDDVAELAGPHADRLEDDVLNSTAAFDDLILAYSAQGNATTVGGNASYSDFIATLEEMVGGMQDGMLALTGGISFIPDLKEAVENMGQLVAFMLSSDYDPNSTSPAAKATLIAVSLNSSIPREEMEGAQWALLDIADAQAQAAVLFTPISEMVIFEEINEVANESLTFLMPVAFILVIVILLITYRTLLDTFISLACLALAILWVFGSAVFLGYNLDVMIVAVPILIIGLGIDYGIHLTMRYREELSKGKKIDVSLKITIVAVGEALLLATVTTSIGFLSNMSSSLEAIAKFGLLATLGIVYSLFIMITLLPAVKKLVDTRREMMGKRVAGRTNEEDRQGNGSAHRAKASGVAALNRGLGFGAYVAEKRPAATLVIVGIVTVASLYGALNLSTEFDFMDFLPNDAEGAEGLFYLFENFEFSTSYSYVLVKGDVAQPDILLAIKEAGDNAADDVHLDHTEDIETAWSVLERYGTANPAFGEYNATFVSMFADADTDGDGVPDQNITELYDWLYENEQSESAIKGVLHRSDENGYNATVLRAKVAPSGLSNVAEMESDLEADSAGLFAAAESGELDEVIVTGGSIVEETTIMEINSNQIRSIMITIAVSLMVLVAAFFISNRTIALGFITIVPVLLVMTWMWGAMYLLDISLNVMTNMIASMSIGMGITYAVHLSHRFVEELDKFDSVYEAATYSVTHTGSAIFGAAATTMCGFGVVSLSALPPMAQFGLITSLAILFSFIATVFVLPTLLVIWANFRKKRGLDDKDDDPFDEDESAGEMSAGGGNADADAIVEE